MGKIWYHQLDVLDVETPRSQIRSYQHLRVTALKLPHSVIALTLLQVPVQTRRLDTHVVDDLLNKLRVLLTRAEH
jgi:hypothetical protein